MARYRWEWCGRSTADVAELAADFLRRFESTAEQDAALYFNSMVSKDASVPARAGYQLGVLVVRELSKAVFDSDHGALVAGRSEAEDPCGSRADQEYALVNQLKQLPHVNA